MVVVITCRIAAFHIVKRRQNVKRIMDTSAVHHHNIAIPIIHSVSIQQIIVGADIFAGRNTIFNIGRVSRVPICFCAVYKLNRIFGQSVGIFREIFITQKGGQPFVRSVHGTLVRNTFYDNGVPNSLYNRSRCFGFRKSYGIAKHGIAERDIFTVRFFIAVFFTNDNRCARCFFKQSFQFGRRIFHGSCIMVAHRVFGHKNRIFTYKVYVVIHGYVDRTRITYSAKRYACRNSR